MLTVVCVLKSGGDYTTKYVRVLRDAMSRHLDVEYNFVCYTDFDHPINQVCETRPLLHEYPGWWSKIEVFRETGRVIYFDLDTYILGPLGSLARALDPGTFYMLRPFHRKEVWASGIMAWNGDFSFVEQEFDFGRDLAAKWDQRYISRKLRQHRVNVRSVQSELRGVRSFKRHCVTEVPPRTRVVCFHGALVKPHLIQYGWAQEMWNNV